MSEIALCVHGYVWGCVWVGVSCTCAVMDEGMLHSALLDTVPSALSFFHPYLVFSLCPPAWLDK